MPVKKQDAKRALLLLEQYHIKLTKPGDVNLRHALEQVMDIFRSDLFHALIDIQEYYEMTLMDSLTDSSESPSSEHGQQYTDAVNDDLNNPMPAHFSPQMNNNAIEQARKYRQSPEESPNKEEGKAPYANEKESITNTQMKKPPITHTHKYENHDPVHFTAQNLSPPPVPLYEYEDIVLERQHIVVQGSAGLGFSIAGGKDNPIDPDDVSIYITKIIPGGGAASDGRLRANDAIITVNGMDTSDVCHSDAVEALTAAGSRVELRTRRRVDVPPPIFLPPDQQARHLLMEQDHLQDAGRQEANELAQEKDALDIRLIKRSKGLGFSIVGGAGNQHVPGDNSIFITKIIEGGAAEADGTLRVGDKILTVDGKSLVDVTHEKAVAILKSTSDVVNLKIVQPEHPLGHMPPAITPFQESYPPVQRAENRGDYVSAEATHSMGNRSDMGATSHPDEFFPETSATPLMQPQTTEKADSVDPYQNVLPPEMVALQLYHLDNHPQTIARESRLVTLNKTGPGLGFNIVGGDGNDGIFISYILTGGTADLSGQLHRGDQILSVNGIDLTKATHEEAAYALKSAEKVVSIMAQYKPEGCLKPTNTNCLFLLSGIAPSAVYQKWLADEKDKSMHDTSHMLYGSEAANQRLKSSFAHPPLNMPAEKIELSCGKIGSKSVPQIQDSTYSHLRRVPLEKPQETFEMPQWTPLWSCQNGMLRSEDSIMVQNNAGVVSWRTRLNKLCSSGRTMFRDTKLLQCCEPIKKIVRKSGPRVEKDEKH